MKISIILFLIISCSGKEQKISKNMGYHLANMYAGGQRDQCMDKYLNSVADKGNVPFNQFRGEVRKCETLFWKVYCTYNIGNPDKKACEKNYRKEKS